MSRGSDVHLDRSFWPQVKNAIRALVAFTFSHVGVCGLVVGYMICGAFLFQVIESQEISRKPEEVQRLREETAERLLSIVLEFNIVEKDEFFRLADLTIMNYTLEIVSAINDGYEGDSGNRMMIPSSDGDGRESWSFPGAFLYSLTVITTIGYGNVTPKTSGGKITTIVYGIIGMPIFFLYLANIGDILARGFKWSFARCCQCRWNCVRPKVEGEGEDEDDGSFDEGAEDGPAAEVEQITVPISVCLAVMVGYVWGGGLLFAKWEKWSVLDASYFCFISLSTIGFGDLVPGDAVYAAAADGTQDAIQLSFVFCSLYLLLGMALIAMCFNLMQEEVIAKVRVCGKRLGCSR